MPLPKISDDSPGTRNGVKHLTTEDFQGQLVDANRGMAVQKLVKLTKARNLVPELEIGDDLTTIGERVKAALAAREAEPTGD